jgi:hypothetical protein
MASTDRQALLEQIRQEKGASEQTEILIEYIQELWETIDLLRQVFGDQKTQEVIYAPSTLLYSLEEIEGF